MSQPGPSIPMRGAIDLAAVAAQSERRRQAEAAGPGASTASPYVIDVLEQDFQRDVVERSMTVPVLVDLYVQGAEPCVRLNATLERLATEYAGRLLLAKVDVDVNPRIAQVFQAQSVPVVIAVVKGQPIPLFQGAVPDDQARQYLDELLRVAQANGVTGRVEGAPDAAADVASEDAEPEPPPLHQAAYEAIEADDLDAAERHYQQALAQQPTDDMARAGLAQVHLLQRTRGADLQAARAAAAAAPTDVAAQAAGGRPRRAGRSRRGRPGPAGRHGAGHRGRRPRRRARPPARACSRSSAPPTSASSAPVAR
nr:thioredoxin domain-containing protein [Angustibacter aerolatus]